MARSTVANGEAALEPKAEGLAEEPFTEPEPEGDVPPMSLSDTIAAAEVADSEMVAPMMSVTGGMSATVALLELLSPPSSAGI